MSEDAKPYGTTAPPALNVNPKAEPLDLEAIRARQAGVRMDLASDAPALLAEVDRLKHLLEVAHGEWGSRWDERDEARAEVERLRGLLERVVDTTMASHRCACGSHDCGEPCDAINHAAGCPWPELEAAVLAWRKP